MGEKDVLLCVVMVEIEGVKRVLIQSDGMVNIVNEWHE